MACALNDIPHVLCADHTGECLKWHAAPSGRQTVRLLLRSAVQAQQGEDDGVGQREKCAQHAQQDRGLIQPGADERGHDDLRQQRLVEHENAQRVAPNPQDAPVPRAPRTGTPDTTAPAPSRRR